jgi:hypothetical protein
MQVFSSTPRIARVREGGFDYWIIEADMGWEDGMGDEWPAMTERARDNMSL